MSEIARLEALMAADPGAPAFPALAEANRRAGRLKEAERVARDGLRHAPESQAGRVALALALLDLGQAEDARSELGRVLESVPDHPVAGPAFASQASGGGASEALSDIADAELDDAFAEAESQRDEMMDANRVAAAAVAAAALDEPEGVLPSAADSPFATETMASLLDEQGHPDDARAVRHQLAGREVEPGFQETRASEPSPESGLGDEIRVRVIATLERWLENLRRDSR